MKQFKENGIESKKVWLTKSDLIEEFGEEEIDEKIKNYDGKSKSSNEKSLIYEIPKEIKYLDDECFTNTDFEIVILHERIERIGEYCFRNCRYLKKCEIPSTITTYPENIFYRCFLMEKKS